MQALLNKIFSKLAIDFMGWYVFNWIFDWHPWLKLPF